MFQRGWFLIDAELAHQLSPIIRRYGVARVEAFDAQARKLLDAAGCVAGVITQVSRDDVERTERLRAEWPRVPVLALLAAADCALINPLQQRGVEVAVLPVAAPSVVSFAQRALASCFLPHDGVAQVVAHLAHTRNLTAREVQILSFCLGNEPRSRVRRRLGIAENTLKTQVKSLLRKCNERSVDALAKNVLRAALIGAEGAPRVGDEPVAPWFEYKRASGGF